VTGDSRRGVGTVARPASAHAIRPTILTSIADDLLASRRLFVCTLLGAIFVYGYPLTNFALHIDEEMAAIYKTIHQNIGVGRWGIVIIRTILIPDPVVPFFLPTLSILLLTATAVAASHALRLADFHRQVFALLFVSFPQFAYQMEFLNQTECVALGMLCSILAYAILARAFFGSARLSPTAIAAAIGLLVVATSVYQSIIFVFSTACCLSCLHRAIFYRAGAASIAREVAAAFAVAVVSYAVYAVINEIVQLWARLPPQDTINYRNYLDSLVGWKNHAWSDVLRDIRIALWDDTTGRAFYGNAIYVTVWLAAACIIGSVAAGDFSIGQKALVAALVIAAIVSPFAVVAALGQQQEPRTLVAEPLAFAGLWAIALARIPRRWPLLAGIAVSCSLLFGSFHVSRMFFADTMSWEADKLLGNRILGAIYRADPAFDEQATPVYFSGAYAPPNIWRASDYNMFGQSFFAWDGGNNLRIAAFLRASGIASLRPPYPPELEAAKPFIAGLPSWPNPDSVKLIQGVVVVKLGGS
jgi:hypothetical protein